LTRLYTSFVIPITGLEGTDTPITPFTGPAAETKTLLVLRGIDVWMYDEVSNVFRFGTLYAHTQNVGSHTTPPTEPDVCTFFECTSQETLTEAKSAIQSANWRGHLPFAPGMSMWINGISGNANILLWGWRFFTVTPFPAFPCVYPLL
jgi:hypothetical protein